MIFTHYFQFFGSVNLQVLYERQNFKRYLLADVKIIVFLQYQYLDWSYKDVIQN